MKVSEADLQEAFTDKQKAQQKMARAERKHGRNSEKFIKTRRKFVEACDRLEWLKEMGLRVEIRCEGRDIIILPLKRD